MPYYTVFAATDFLNKESGGVNSVLKLIGLIILCILIIVASYYTTKFVGKKQLGRSPKSNFRSIDVFRLSTNKYLQIVEILNLKRFYPAIAITLMMMYYRPMTKMSVMKYCHSSMAMMQAMKYYLPLLFIQSVVKM